MRAADHPVGMRPSPATGVTLRSMIPMLVRTERRPRSAAPVADRVARASLWALLVVLVLRAGADDLRTVRLRVKRIASAWWADIERRSRQDVRRSQIGFVAGRIGTRNDRTQHRRRQEA